MNSISAKEFLIITVLVSAFVGFSYGFDCYYCDPSDKGCHDPDAEARVHTHCDDIKGNDNPMNRVLEQERNRVDNNTEITYKCAALKISNKDNKSYEGFYRTCVVDTTKGDHCAILKDEFENDKYGKVINCMICDEQVCNNWTAATFKNSSPESFSSVLLYTFFSCFFVLYVI